MIGSSQNSFKKGKSHLTNFIGFFNSMTGLVGKGRAVDVVYLDFSRAFNTVPNNVFIHKLIKCRLDKWTVK